MPRYERKPGFTEEFLSLSVADRKRFLAAVQRFIAALKANRPPPHGLGIRQMTNHPGIYEFHFSEAGRATFAYGTTARGNDALIIWRRIGGHEIYREP